MPDLLFIAAEDLQVLHVGSGALKSGFTGIYEEVVQEHLT